ncbi:hypothetical protein [Crossiella sp. NPDC003009]
MSTIRGTALLRALDLPDAPRHLDTTTNRGTKANETAGRSRQSEVGFAGG